MRTNEEKQLLLQDLCARLPYGVFVEEEREKMDPGPVVYTYDYHPHITDCKPYLRPMSSMTEEEKDELLSIINKEADMIRKQLISGDCGILEGKYHFNNCLELDWLLSHYFDYRGLIPMGLALEAPEGMYNN